MLDFGVSFFLRYVQSQNDLLLAMVPKDPVFCLWSGQARHVAAESVEDAMEIGSHLYSSLARPEKRREVAR